MRPDHRIGVGHEEVVEEVTGVVLFQAVGRPPRRGKMRVARAVDIGLDLGQKAGYQVDRARELRHFLQVERHPQVIFGRVQPAPRASGFRRRHHQGNTVDDGARIAPGKPVPSFVLEDQWDWSWSVPLRRGHFAVAGAPAADGRRYRSWPGSPPTGAKRSAQNVQAMQSSSSQ